MRSISKLYQQASLNSEDRYWVTVDDGRAHRVPITHETMRWRRRDIRDNMDLPKHLRVDALISLFSSEWFSRMWILQEAMLATQAICFKGRECRSWVEVMTAARWLKYKHENQSKTRHADLCSLPNLERCWLAFNHYDHFLYSRDTGESAGSELRKVLALATNFNATDLRDKVFATLSLISEYPSSLKPDYEIDPTKLHIQACREAISQERSLKAAIYAPLSANQDTALGNGELPSWVMNLKGRTSFDLPVALIEPANEYVSTVQAHFKMYQEGHYSLLKVRGLVVDEVLCDPTPQLMFRETGTSAMREDLLAAKRTVYKQSPLLSEEKFMVGLACVLTAGKSTYWRTLVDWYRSDGESKAMSAWKVPFREVFDPSYHAPREESWTLVEIGDVREALVASSRNRSFFMTKSGKMGTGFPWTRKGDKVCILYGAATPVILRPAGRYWVMVSDAYIQAMTEVM